MIKTLIVYESKYGFTERISMDLAKILGPANICKPSEFKDIYKEFDMFVICTPIYEERVDEGIIRFAKANEQWLQHKKVILLCSCLFTKGAEKYLKELGDMLGDSVLLQGTASGVMDINKLHRDDYMKIQEFSKKAGIPCKSYDTFNNREFVNLALKIKELKDTNCKVAVNKQDLKKHIEEFLNSHNTCCLCTGAEDNIRSTPIEYSYIDEHIYFMSEGGEKFAHMLLNNRVSIAIYDSFKTMSDLGGMQITGISSSVEIYSKEYIEVLENRGLKYEQLVNLPIIMNVVKVSIEKVEFLWSNFKSLGYEAKQIYFSKEVSTY